MAILAMFVTNPPCINFLHPNWRKPVSTHFFTAELQSITDNIRSDHIVENALKKHYSCYNLIFQVKFSYGVEVIVRDFSEFLYLLEDFVHALCVWLWNEVVAKKREVRARH